MDSFVPRLLLKHETDLDLRNSSDQKSKDIRMMFPHALVRDRRAIALSAGVRWILADPGPTAPDSEHPPTLGSATSGLNVRSSDACTDALIGGTGLILFPGTFAESQDRGSIFGAVVQQNRSWAHL